MNDILEAKLYNRLEGSKYYLYFECDWPEKVVDCGCNQPKAAIESLRPIHVAMFGWDKHQLLENV